MNLALVLVKSAGKRAAWFDNETMMIKRVGGRGSLERRMEVLFVG